MCPIGTYTSVVIKLKTNESTGEDYPFLNQTLAPPKRGEVILQLISTTSVPCCIYLYLVLCFTSLHLFIVLKLIYKYIYI